MEAGALGDGVGTQVTVEVDWNVLRASIEAELVDEFRDLSGLPPSEQEAQHELRRWQRGALHGASHALEIANSLPCAVRITEICGEFESTNPTVVAAACARAVWQAMGYAPTEQQCAHLDHAVATSFSAGPEALPVF